jgi:hypothetical protein
MDRRLRRINSLLACCLGIALFSSTSAYPTLSRTPTPQRTFNLRLSRSNILSKVSERSKKQPSLTPKELALYANGLIEKGGFDYSFDVCDAFKKTKGISSATSASARSYRMRLTGGRKLTFRFIVGSPEDSLCGECWSEIPSLQVTKREMLLVAKGKRYRVNRPASFLLDEAELVDGTMKKVLRTWQLPYQAVPIGVSADGTKLYLDLYTEYELEGLVLELSETGGIQFLDRDEVQLQSEGKWIENHPKDPGNAYLSYMRFQVGERYYIVRFSAPCT